MQQDDDFSDGEDEDMSVDDCPNDDKTLNQYQEEVRRESFVRKRSQSVNFSQKKVRVEPEDPSVRSSLSHHLR